ncbi:Valine--tRNA ligase,valyl-tRNA synthetase,Valyl-tRNA synthetase,valine--tRNA ligase,tRNA synthetases class I (I, L, M and V) [Chlamydia serpentis]|uniref:Valine--tRNA ligase n=1 Tax=Chlamydia serpentis TaxID=1967782 RepID=A0A2R8FA66_9CHLA|nr:valine--tRNA ligase [Chlamydia serpentis]SPN73261.1 Valine--tRNA ligase,valyl-tRNA synthetase,Valyl-tRNA synthetase,valine--tRNA ligase,tRNA synthetases class I (I, L, M and V) [Chlamydia serpentis]
MKVEDFPKAYDFKAIEPELYVFWEKKGMFQAEVASDKPPYCVIMPPPNVTGVLHMGHALVNTLQDILVRYKRMSGFEVCWIPGTDHAGIATQTVVERHLQATEGKRRTDYSREEFLKHVWTWKEKSEGVILSQLRQLGCSCDWNRKRFTMDPLANRAVKKAFKALFDNRYIYRGYYLVNWDPILQTALADDEVEYEEKDGWLYYISYRIVDSNETIVVATTRPETLLGDTAIAVSPSDPRYASWIGASVEVPFVNRQIPIIGDASVDPTFGTGAVKITPAHDKDDYLMGIHHNLPSINILTPCGRINENGGIFSGMTKEKAREEILLALEKQGLFIRKEPYKLRVGVSYRSGAVIEPYLSKQWFISVSEFRGVLRELVENKDIKIFPNDFEKNYLSWVNHLRDWCISRQLWWGHRIPVWYHKDDEERILCYDGEGVPEEVAQDPDAWYQDPDVLDTWFSSGLWPLTCLGWPDAKSPDLNKFYPTAVLVTGHDILFFWVTRMVLLCSSMTEKKPFSEVFLHGLIFGKSYKRYNEFGDWSYISGKEKLAYDMGEKLPSDVIAKWEKLSKSKGNVIDPLEMIATYGTDAVRLALCSCANRGEQIDLDYRLFEEYKHFANKIWNGARFIFSHISDLQVEELLIGIDQSALGLEDFYILDGFNHLICQLEEAYATYAFDKVASLAYEFFRNDLCSTYIEIIKPVLLSTQENEFAKVIKRKLLAVLLLNVLGVLHPVAPFITESLFLRLKDTLGKIPEGKGDAITSHAVNMLRSRACIECPYPKIFDIEMPKDLKESFVLAQRLVYTIRNIRGEMQLDPRLQLKAFIICSEDIHIQNYIPILQALGGLESIELLDKEPEKMLYSFGVIDNIRLGIFVPKEHLIKEKTRLEKERLRLEGIVENLERLLGDENFCQKANPSLVNIKREALKNNRVELQSILDKLMSFS